MKLAPVSKVIHPHPRYDNKRVLSWSDVVAIENGNYPHTIPPSRKMLFGSYIHGLIEKDQLPIRVPRGTHHEVSVQHGRFVGTIDSYDDTTIIDYKTATKHWSRLKAQTHDQLTYYAYLLWKDKGVRVTESKIVSIETGWNEDDELIVQDTVVVHTNPITLSDMLRVKARADSALRTLRLDFDMS